MGALAKLNMFGNDGYGTIGTDLDEGTKGPKIKLLGPDTQEVHGGTADQKGAAGDNGTDHEVAAGRGKTGAVAGKLGLNVHDALPYADRVAAASLIAARIR